MQNKGGKYCVQSATHSKELVKNVVSLIERQSMVDIAICCGNNTIHAHKCILAANSSYFKENLEDRAVEQMLITGMEFAVIKAFVEYMYCGEMIVAEEHMKYFFAGLKLFKIHALENVFSDADMKRIGAEEIIIPPPQFITKPAKYPSIYKPLNNCFTTKQSNNFCLVNPYNQNKLKKKSIVSDAEKACYKEEQASKIALANLRKSMNNQLHSFIVEESFNETTVENFIPNDVEFVGNDLNPVLPQESQPSITSNPTLTTDKIKYMLGNSEVEIVFQTSDGNLVNVSDEVLQDLSKEGLQYQVIDENGQISEIQELQTLENHENSVPSKAIISQIVGNGLKIVTPPPPAPTPPLPPPPPPLPLPPSTTTTTTAITKIEEDTDLNLMGDNLYENTLKVQNSDYLEPENLSINTNIVDDSMDIDHPIDVGCIKRSDAIEIKPLKFAPEMFFADYSDREDNNNGNSNN